ncbi:hypothetical protein Tco_0845047 [Tanacetum coccineum]
MTRRSTKGLVPPFEDPAHVFRSNRKLSKTTSLDSSSFIELEFVVELENQFNKEETTTTMTEQTMEEYMKTTRDGYGPGVVRPEIQGDQGFKIKRHFLKELHTNTFSGSDHEDPYEHIEKVLEIADLFHIPKITTDQETLKKKILGKYCPPARTAKKMEEINNFQQEPDETLYAAWERFKELLLKCPQHYLTDIQEVIAKRGTETSDGLAAIQAQLNNLRREIKKVNEKVYAAQAGCEKCKGPHYTKYCPNKDDDTTFEEAYYTQFGVPYPQGQSLEDAVSKFMTELAKRHEENSNLIKEIRAATNSAIRNQGASIKALEIQIGQMSKVLQE